jgi:RimJ/RimL family protein N-acetyltransferase
LSGIALLPWSDDDLWAVERFLTDPEMGRGCASEALAMLVAQLRREHADRSLHAFPSITNGPSNAVCRTPGFINLGEHEFEYPAGHPLQCNDWRLDLSPTTDRLEPRAT